MKTRISIAALSLVLLTGCVQLVTKQVQFKSTVFGLQVSASPTGGAMPSIKLGLIRDTYLSNPTSTNGPVYAAPFVSSASGDIAPLHQTATENISTK